MNEISWPHTSRICTAYEFSPLKSLSYLSFLPYFLKGLLVITGVDGSGKSPVSLLGCILY